MDLLPSKMAKKKNTSEVDPFQLGLTKHTAQAPLLGLYLIIGKLSHSLSWKFHSPFHALLVGVCGGCTILDSLEPKVQAVLLFALPLGEVTGAAMQCCKAWHLLYSILSHLFNSVWAA